MINRWFTVLMGSLVTLPMFCFGGEPPEVEWEQLPFTDPDVQIRSSQQTTDDGYIATGNGLPACQWQSPFLGKVDREGNEIWSQVLDFCGSTEWGFDVCQARDGGFVLVGSMAEEIDGGRLRIYLVKTDSSGGELWRRTFVGSDGFSVQQTTDDGYIIAGAGPSGVSLLLKTDSEGREDWRRSFGVGRAFSLQVTSDGGYIVVGFTETADVYLAKTDSDGRSEWQRILGGPMYEEAYMLQTTDGGYIVAGTTRGRRSDIYLIKTDSEGRSEWQRTFGGEGSERAHSVQQTRDGGYIVAGGTEGQRGYVVRTDLNGNEVWSFARSTVGGSSYRSVQLSNDGGYVLFGFEGALIKLAPEGRAFLRGDCNGDGQVSTDVTDAVFLLMYNFGGGPSPACLAACDANGDGEVLGQVTDAIYLLTHNFRAGPVPPEPFPECGPGTEADLAVGCETPPDCR